MLDAASYVVSPPWWNAVLRCQLTLVFAISKEVETAKKNAFDEGRACQEKLELAGYDKFFAELRAIKNLIMGRDIFFYPMVIAFKRSLKLIEKRFI